MDNTSAILDCVQQSRRLQFEVESSEIQGWGADTLDEIARRALCLPERMERAWEEAIESLYHEELHDVQTVGRILQSVNDACLEVFRVLKQRSGLAHDDATLRTACEKALAEHVRLKHRIAAEWPWIDAGMIAGSLAEFERGEGIPLEDMIGELQSGGGNAG